MLDILFNKWLFSLIITIFILIIIYCFKDKNRIIKNKKDIKLRNKYYFKIGLLLYLFSVVLFYIYEYFSTKNIKLFTGGNLNNINNNNNNLPTNIKIIDVDIDTDPADW